MDDFPPSKLDKKEIKTEPSEFPDEEVIEDPKEDLPDFMKLLEAPMIQGLFGGCKDLFKKKETDPNVCEITIKAPSEVVLKIFGLQ